MSYEGHDPVHTGLQKHSIGGYYPLVLVAIDNPEPIGTRYVVCNVLTAKYACHRDGRPWQWWGAEVAAAWLDKAVLANEPLLWCPGRPEYSEALGVLVLRN